MENLDLGLNLGFGTASGIDDLIDKIEILQKNIANINEVSNVDMFTNALRNFQELKKEIKEIKELFNSTQSNKVPTGDTKNPYKNETFGVSQTLKNIEKSLNEITNLSKVREHKSKVETKKTNTNQTVVNDKTTKINSELKEYYSSMGKTYKDKKNVNTEPVSPMTEKQFTNGFSKLVRNISKEVADTLDTTIREKMIRQGSVDMLKGKKYSNENELLEEYRKISNLVKNSGYNGNLLKNNPQFKREYNEIVNSLNNNVRQLNAFEKKLINLGINVKPVNVDSLTNKQIQNLIQERTNTFKLLSNERFRNFNKNVEYSSVQEKYNDYRKTVAENMFKAQDIKSKGLSLPNTIQQNSGLVFAGLEAFRYLGAITNFLTSKDFERNMGALGIVGNLGNQASQNYSKNRIMRESNIIGADINDFATSVREVIKTGKSYEQSMNLVSVAGKVAIASFEDLTTATNILNSRFTALNLTANDKNLNDFANRLQSALDNTALDLQDVRNAGKQTNTAMNAIINSAEERGLQNKNVEQYTMDVSNLELALLSTLKQQGKTGEQSGIVLRTLFTKLMSVDGVGKKMLDNDFKKMTKEEKERVGFSSVEEMTNLVLGGEIEKVIEGLSIMQEQGNLAYSTIKKLFTERHSSAISTLLSEVGGDVKEFVDNITTGINVFNNFSKAMENWSVKVDRIFKNIKSVATNTFSRGVFGGVLGAGVGTLDFVTDNLVKGQASDNVFLSGSSQAFTQAIIQGIAFKNVNDFTKGKAFQNIESAYDLAKQRIIKDPTITGDVLKSRLSTLDDLKSQDLESLINGKGLKSFAGQLKNANADVYKLSSTIKQTVESGSSGFSVLSTSVKGFGTAVAYALKTTAILFAINTAINVMIGLYEKANALKNEADNLDKDIANLSRVGKDIERMEENIKTIFDMKDVNEPNDYLANIHKMIQANEQLKESIINVNNIKNNPFKDIDTIRQEIWKEKTKNSLDTITNPQNSLRGRGEIYIGDNGNAKIDYGNNARFSLFEWGDEYRRNDLVKYRGSQFKGLNIYNKQRDNYYLDLLSKKESSSLDRARIETARSEEIKTSKSNIEKYSNEFKVVDKKINKIYDNAYDEFKTALKKQGITEKNVSKEERDNFIISKMKISKDIISDVFGEDIASKFGNGGVQNTSDFYKLLQQLEGNSLEEKIQTFYEFIASGEIEPETINFLGKYGDYQINTIKESNDLFYKQLERNKESLEQSKALMDTYKSQIRSMYEKTGLPSVAYGKLLNEEKDDDNKLITLSQDRLDVYNDLYNTEINGLPSEMFTNNPDGVRDYQASLGAYYQKRAGLDKQIEDTTKEIEKMKKLGNQQELDNLNKKLNYLNEDMKTLEKSKELSKKVLYFSNFSAKSYKDLLTMGSELAKANSQFETLVGTSFGNRGSQLQSQLSGLNISRALFNEIGTMNYDNQINSAYIQDPNASKLGTITGKTDYRNVTLDDYNKIQERIDYYRKNNINTLDNISVEDLQEQATVVSSIIGEQYNLEQQKLGLMQQEKQLQIDITKYYLDRNKLIANFTESAETKQSDYALKSAGLNYSLRYGNGNYNSIEELQRVTNLKLENSNLKMKDQLDYAKRQIMVARENSTRQINAIRRLESKNTSNSQKSDTNANQNTNEIKNTISNSAELVANNLNNALNQIMTSIQSVQSSYNPVDDSGTPVTAFSGDIVDSALDLTSRRETGKGVSIGASRAVAKDTGGSLSYGIFGVNNKTDSYKTFYDMVKHRFPELSSKDSPQNWRMVADKYGQEFINAQVEWKRTKYSSNVFGKSIESFIKKYTGLVNDNDVKRAGIYLVDASTQYGSGGLISAVKSGKFKGMNNINDVLNAFNQHEKNNVHSYFRSSLKDGSASVKGLFNGFNMRLNYSKNGTFSTNGNNANITLSEPKLPKEYVPKLDRITDDTIKEITNYEMYKDLIKTEKDNKMLSEVAKIINDSKGKTFNEGIADLINKRNSIKNIMTADETYDVSLNVIEQAISNFESKMETGQESYDKLQQKFTETLAELQFSFKELQNVVKMTNIEYTNAYNFLSQVSFTDSFNEFISKIDETQAKLEQYNKKLNLETSFDNNIRQNLFGLMDKNNIVVSGNALNTNEDMKKFLTDRNQMLEVIKIVEDRIENSLGKNFDNLEFDKAGLRGSSADEVDKIKNEMITLLGSKGTGQDNLFNDMNELNNLFETLKLLKTQIEKTNDVRRTEIELIKQNNKYLSEYSKNISNMVNELSVIDGSKARGLRTLMAETDLARRGIPLDSAYGRSYLNRVNSRNKMEEYREEVINFNRMLKYDSSLRNILKGSGFTDSALDNYDLNNTNYDDLKNMANIILDYQDSARNTVQLELNELINKFSLNDVIKNLDLTDTETIRNLNADVLANKTGNSVSNMQEFINGVNILKNSYHNTEDLLDTLNKVMSANKSAYEENTKVYQELYKQGLNLLSDMLFGDGEFKGLGKEQYTQALDTLLQFGINSFGNISKSFKGMFGKENETTFNKTTKSKSNSDTGNLVLNTLNGENLLISASKNTGLMASTDGFIVLPELLNNKFKQPSNMSGTYSNWTSPLIGNSFTPFNNSNRENYAYVSDMGDTLPLAKFDNKSLKDKILNNNNDTEINKKQSMLNTFGNLANLSLNSIIVIDGFMKKQMQYKKQELELQGKILEMNLQMAETTEERRRIEEQILQNKLAQVDNEYNTSSSFMGGAISGTAGFGIQGALSGAMTGMSLGGGVGALAGAGLGLIGGIFGGTSAKIQAEQQKAQLIAQQKLQWLAEDRNKYLKTMASAMNEQVKWTTKIGVNDAISRSVRAVISSTDTIGGTASDTRTVQNKKKKGGGLLGSKKYDTVQAFTASYNTNDTMFGGRVFDDRTDLDFAYGVLAKRILGNQLLNKTVTRNILNNSNDLKFYNGKNTIYKNSDYYGYGKRNKVGNTIQENITYSYENSLAEYLDRKIASSNIELNADQFIKAFNGQSTLGSMGMLIDTSRDGEIRALISNMKDQYSKMEASQEKVDMLALINFYENIQALLDKEGKTTKRLFGNYYGIETDEVKDEKGNITEYRRVNESMWSDLYQQQFQNVMNGSNTYDVGSNFIQGTVNAFIQNVSSSRSSVKAITEEFNRLADEIYNVVTRTGEFSNVSSSIKGLIDNMETLREQQKETEKFTVDLAKRWVDLGGNITDVVKDMNNGLSLAVDNIKSNMLGDSLESTINSFGSNLFQILGESITTNLVNQKYANSIFEMNSLLTNATDTNSISDIVALANGYKGMSVQIESDRERLSAIQRLFTANRDIDYVDESIQYETGTSQSVTNNYTFTTDINAGTIVADELSKEILAQNLFAPLVQMLKDSGFIK